MRVNVRLKIAAVVVLLIALALPVNAQHFYFAQITDTHFGRDNNAERAAKVVASVNALPVKIEAVVVTGDIFDECILDDKVVQTALDTFKALRPPVYYLPGNNDIVENDQAPAMRDAFIKHIGPLASKTVVKGVVFLMVYTEPLRVNVGVEFDALKWLKRELDDAGDRPVIIFTHTPVDRDFYLNKMHPGWPDANRKKLESLISANKNVKAVITGHFHRDEFHWIGDTPEFVCPPVSSLFDRQNAYRMYEYNDGKVSYRTIHLD
ncbi:MAG: metallophosphoesterase family protein [Armatimonadota bacterium]